MLDNDERLTLDRNQGKGKELTKKVANTQLQPTNPKLGMVFILRAGHS
jgi:hypothetical protein